MKRDLLIALSLSLAAVLGTVERMHERRAYNVTISETFPQLERHLLNAIMATAVNREQDGVKQEAERATRTLSKIAGKTSFNREQVEQIRHAAHLVLSAANDYLYARERCRELARSCTDLIAEYRELGPLMPGERTHTLISSEIGDTHTDEEVLARRDELYAYKALLIEKVRQRRENAQSAPPYTPRFRAA